MTYIEGFDFEVFDAKKTLDALRWHEDMIITNHEGDTVWLCPCFDDSGKRIGITDCCFVSEPCEHHAAIAERERIRQIIREEIERAIGKRIASVEELRAAAAQGQHVAYNLRYRAPADAVIANRSPAELAALIEDGVVIIQPFVKEQP